LILKYSYPNFDEILFKMVAKRDVETMEDVQNLVNTFYGRIREDELLGPIFNDTIQDRWPEHLEKMYSFWQTILLQEHTYSF
jgi:hemoglobin